jgi:hypothetical protein
MNPMVVLKAAIKAVPSLRYALGIAGIAAVVAIILGLGLHPQIAVFGTLMVIGVMFILVVFSRYAGSQDSSFKGPATLLVWFFTVVTMAAITLLATSYFLQWPLPLGPKLPDAVSLVPPQHVPEQQPLYPSHDAAHIPERSSQPQSSTISTAHGVGTSTTTEPEPPDLFDPLLNQHADISIVTLYFPKPPDELELIRIAQSINYDCRPDHLNDINGMMRGEDDRTLVSCRRGNGQLSAVTVSWINHICNTRPPRRHPWPYVAFGCVGEGGDSDHWLIVESASP